MAHPVMVSECFEHRIERPSGISGYRPAVWCAVCGRKESLQPVKECTKEGCPNICHVNCLGVATEFSCGNTAQLRDLAGISDPVTPYSRNHQATTDLQTQTDSASQQSVEEPQDDLGDLQKEELVKMVKIARNLRKELASSKSQLSCYRSVTAGLADKRVVLVEAVSIVDTLLATLASEGLVQQTVACTARPHKIVSETGETVTVGSGECDSFSSPSLTSPLSSSPNTTVPLSTIPNPPTPNTSVLLPTLSSPPTHSSPPNTSVPLPTLPTPPTPFSPPNTSVSSSTIPTPPTPSSPPKTSIPLLPSSSAQLNPPSSSTPPTPPTSLDIAALPHPTPSSNNTLPPNSQTPYPTHPNPTHPRTSCPAIPCINATARCAPNKRGIPCHHAKQLCWQATPP
ncbi:putative protein TPRXL [Portunus trituberculatus]|uniref:putative protein TPRXL n=1 Tax=Portunus trituberculatus TaxID=210409 RepID=UPI001E1CDAE5|nr:putative protein TPRXL [Portunus trituberculatus]